MEINIDGNDIETVDDFHRCFAIAIDIENVYGSNLHALWDVLSASLERPSTLIWKNSFQSKLNLGSDFDSIIEVLQRAVDVDVSHGLKNRFNFNLL